MNEFHTKTQNKTKQKEKKKKTKMSYREKAESYTHHVF